MTVTVPSVYYASSAGYTAVTAWHTPWTPTVGNLTRQTAPTVANERTFVCIISGVGGVSEPTWVVTKGAKTVDNLVTWMECLGNCSLNGDLTNTPLSSVNRSGSQALGAIITNNTQDHYFICTTAGSTGAGEPTYVTTLGGTTTDSGCTWTCLGTVGSFTAWLSPASRIANLASFGWLPSTLATVYVSSSHAETQATAISIGIGGSGTVAPSVVYCIPNGGAIPPTSITTGATVTTTGNSSITLSGNVNWNGVAFSCGTGANGPTLTVGAAGGGYVRVTNGALNLPSTSFGNIKFGGLVELTNVTMALGSTIGIVLQAGIFIWRDTPSALSTTGTFTTILFNNGSGAAAGVALFEGVDLSAFSTSGSSIFYNSNGTGYNNQRIILSHCKLGLSYLFGATGSGTIPLLPGSPANSYADVINCDTGGATYNTQRYTTNGLQSINTGATAANGASDGTTAVSWLVNTTSSVTIAATQPFECIPISVWNTVTGSTVTVTLQAAYAGSSLPNNAQVWLDVVYFGTSSSTLSTRGTSAPAIFATPTTWSAASTTWSANAPARSNSHAYNLGDVIGVSSASSIVRAFACTTAGTSSGSLPGAYATAVDGTNVTDNTAHFTALNRYSLVTVLSSPTPQAAGYFVCYIRVGLNGIHYFDPLPVLS